MDVPLFELRMNMHKNKVSGIEKWRTTIAKLEELGVTGDSIWLKQAKFKVKIRSILQFDAAVELEKWMDKMAYAFECDDLFEEPLMDQLELAKYEYNYRFVP